MKKSTRLDTLWLLLVVATTLTWWLGEGHVGGPRIVLLVLVVTGLKGGCIVLDFMALRRVRHFWPGLLLGWLLAVLAIIGLAYRSGMSA